jgi:outer membrane protein assembly factor BamB
MLAASWGSPLIADGKVYIGDEDGDISVFTLSREKNLLGEINMGNSVYSTPIIAGDTLYIANKSHLFAIRAAATPVAKP